MIQRHSPTLVSHLLMKSTTHTCEVPNLCLCLDQIHPNHVAPPALPIPKRKSSLLFCHQIPRCASRNGEPGVNVLSAKFIKMQNQTCPTKKVKMCLFFLMSSSVNFLWPKLQLCRGAWHLLLPDPTSEVQHGPILNRLGLPWHGNEDVPVFTPSAWAPVHESRAFGVLQHSNPNK